MRARNGLTMLGGQERPTDKGFLMSILTRTSIHTMMLKVTHMTTLCIVMSINTVEA